MDSNFLHSVPHGVMHEHDDAAEHVQNFLDSLPQHDDAAAIAGDDADVDMPPEASASGDSIDVEMPPEAYAVGNGADVHEPSAKRRLLAIDWHAKARKLRAEEASASSAQRPQAASQAPSSGPTEPAQRPRAASRAPSSGPTAQQADRSSAPTPQKQKKAIGGMGSKERTQVRDRFVVDFLARGAQEFAAMGSYRTNMAQLKSWWKEQPELWCAIHVVGRHSALR